MTKVYRASTIFFLSIACSATWAGNFATCLLDKMPNAQNDYVASSAYRTCSAEYPARYGDIEKGSGIGIFSFSNADECILKKAASTRLHRAAGFISSACRCLYDQSEQKGELCDGRIRSKDGSIFDPKTAVRIN